MKTIKSTNLNFYILGNGNLKIIATRQGKSIINHFNHNGDTENLWAELLDPTSCNGSFASIAPGEIGALTDAPIIIDHADYNDAGDLQIYPGTKIWWLENYMLIDEFKNLMLNRPVIFQIS